MIGDPSGKTEMRQLLDAGAISDNIRAIEPQVRRLIGDEALVVNNADWLLSLNYIEFLRDIGRHFSVNRMLAAEAYRQRLEKGLSFIEFNYQLLQAYDFLVLHDRHACVLQIGGDDQWGNIVAGIDLVRRVRQREVLAMTFPLLTTAAGAKMGKTAAGAVWLDPDRTSPYAFYQYFVNCGDADVIRFLKLFTFEPLEVIARLEKLQGADLRDAKRLLARSVTAVVHGPAAAAEADAAARAAFSAGGSAQGDETALPTVRLEASRLSAGLKIVDLLAETGLAPSKSAARRLIAQGGVRVGERKVESLEEVLSAAEIGGGTLLHAGKKQLRRLVLDEPNTKSG
jgi:tyrosyl-tRNA synthetase